MVTIRHTPFELDLVCYRGDDVAHTVWWLEDDGVTAVDLTGWSVIGCTYKESWGSVSSTALAAAITDAAAGEVTVTVARALTESLGNGVYDLELEDDSGNRRTLISGLISFQEGIT